MNDIVSLNLEDQIGLLETKKISSYEAKMKKDRPWIN